MGRSAASRSPAAARTRTRPRARGELLAIYLEPDAVGKGIGRVLFERSVEDLRERGYDVATLWVLETNARAPRFYEAAGWSADGATKTEERPGAVLREVRYRKDLR